jgi:hypothetical protein
MCGFEEGTQVLTPLMLQYQSLLIVIMGQSKCVVTLEQVYEFMSKGIFAQSDGFAVASHLRKFPAASYPRKGVPKVCVRCIGRLANTSCHADYVADHTPMRQ